MMTATAEHINHHQDIDDIRFRQIMGSFPSGVGLVTAGTMGGICAGLTVSSVTSVSKSPPLVSVCLDHRCFTLDLIGRERKFAISIIDGGNADVAARFASRIPDKFDGIDFRPGKLGVPILVNHIAFAECELYRTIPAGDHAIVVGRIIDGASEPIKNPLLYFRGKFYGDVPFDVVN